MKINNFLNQSFCCLGRPGTGKSTVIVSKAWESGAFDRKILIDPKGHDFNAVKGIDEKTIYVPLNQEGLALLGSLLASDAPFR